MDKEQFKELLKDHVEIKIVELYSNWDTEISVRLLLDDEIISEDSFVIEGGAIAGGR